MSDCCTPTSDTDCCATPPDPATASPVCASCSQNGKMVPRLTIESLLKPNAATQLQRTTFRCCATPTCDVVYFSNGSEQYFHKADMTVRVGLKETDHPVPICYCFDYTVCDVEEEISATGTTTISDRIRSEVKAANCRCEYENPQGYCCLGNVGQAVKQAMDNVQILI